MEDKTNIKCENVEQTRDREGENETCRRRTARESQGCSENWGLQLSGGTCESLDTKQARVWAREG